MENFFIWFIKSNVSINNVCDIMIKRPIFEYKKAFLDSLKT